MLFNSFHYLLFYPAVAILYFMTPHKKRHFLLLAASYYFYMSWKPEYLILILTTTLVTFFSAKLIGPGTGRRKLYLAACISIDFGILFVFKYFNFFNSIISDILGSPGSDAFFELKVLLPVGISFYTFQTVSYIIDVYRGKTAPEKDPVFFALYVSFFPQLVAGPIERASNLLPQFRSEHRFDYDRIKSGIGMILLGFFKKIVIADRAAVIVDKAFQGHSGLSSANLFVAVLLFGIQIYCDFSGYSDIAVGSARIMGIELMQNFKRPYFAGSLQEFWKRWHISLSTWFKDYVYIPLGGNRKGKARSYLNIFVTFALSGLWHGANFTFVIWGIVHGSFLIFEKMLRNIKKGILWVIPTYIFVNMAWVLFRSESLDMAYRIYAEIFKLDMSLDIKAFGVSTYQLIVMGASIMVLLAHSIYKESGREIRLLDKFAFASAFFVIIFFGYFSNQEFIYFRF